MQQLLYLEMLLKLAAGLTLLLLPLTSARLFGLPKPQQAFWQRLLGATLLGMAAAIYLEGSGTGSHGLGLGGLVVINAATAALILSSLILGLGAQTGRGRLVLALSTGLLFIVALIEIVVVQGA